MKLLPCGFKFGNGQVTTFAQRGRFETGVTTKYCISMQDSLLVTLLMNCIATIFKIVLVIVPVIAWHSTKNVITNFRYLLLMSFVNILGQLPSTVNIDGMGSLDCTIANEGVIHQV